VKHWTTWAVAGFIAAAAFVPAQAAEITGAGSTFVYPILAKWADAYKKATGIGLNYQSIGSGGGIKQITNKTVTFGASDMPLTPEQVAKAGFIQFPVINGAVVPVVNLDGIKPGELTLDGPTLAKIYLGEIKTWNDPAIQKLNPKLSLADETVSGNEGCLSFPDITAAIDRKEPHKTAADGIRSGSVQAQKSPPNPASIEGLPLHSSGVIEGGGSQAPTERRMRRPL